MKHLLRALTTPLVLALLAPACGNSSPPPGAAPTASAAVTAAATSAPATTAATASAAATAAATADPKAPAGAGGGAAEADAGAASADAGTAADAGAAPIVADNKVAPTEGPELQERAKGLFDAIVKDDPAPGEGFWFPKAAFLPLKDIKDPGKYWDQLHRTYGRDIHALHKKRKSWDGAVFERFDVGSTPKWVKPGDEVNKIGYYRSFHGKLRFTIDGKHESIDVHTVITWQGRWYITHLNKFKK